MNRLFLLLPLWLIVTACSGSLEDACKDVCDKRAECSDVMWLESEILDCKDGCSYDETLAQQALDGERLAQVCYDANRDETSCRAGMTCEQIRNPPQPHPCHAEGVETERACSDDI